MPKTMKVLQDCAVESWRVSCALEEAQLPPHERAQVILESEKIKQSLSKAEAASEDARLAIIAGPAAEWMNRLAARCRQATLEEAAGLSIAHRIALCSGLILLAEWMNCLQRHEATQDENLPFACWPSHARKRSISIGQKLSDELEFGKAWDNNDHWLLQSQARGLPAQLAVIAAFLQGVANHTSDLDAILWQALKAHANEVTQWHKAGFENAWVAAEWLGRAMMPDLARQWHEAGIRGEEADLFMDCGLDDVDEALQLRELCGGMDMFRAWVRLRFTPEEIQAWIDEGAKHPDLAKSMAAAGRVPAVLIEREKQEKEETQKKKKEKEECEAEAKIQADTEIAAKAKAGAEAERQARAKAQAEEKLPVVLSGNISPEIPATPEQAPPQEAEKNNIETDLSDWHKIGISEASEISAWQTNGFTDAAAAEIWRAESLSPEHASAWLAQGVSTPSSAAWLEGCLSQFFSITASDSSSADWIARCLSPWPTASRALLYWGQRVSAEAWHAAGLNTNKIGSWIEKISAAGLVPEDLRISIIRNPQGGTVLVTPADSVTATPAGKGLHAARWELRNAWTQDLALALKALGLQKENTGWHLDTLNDQNHSAAALFFGTTYSGEEPPWAESMDYMPKESWQTRFTRRAEEMGDDPKPPSYEFKKDLSGPTPGWTLYAAASRQHLNDEQGFDDVATHGAWLEPFQDLCRIMDIPLKKPVWTVALVKEL